jgi:hypothetical protein
LDLGVVGLLDQSGDKTMQIKKLVVVSMIAGWIFAAPHQVYAKDQTADKFQISLGGYSLTRNETEMSLTERNTGAGVSINPEDTLGLQTEQSVFRLDGQYRFNPEHSLTFSWYSIATDGSKQIEEEIEWVDENDDPITIPVGARVDTQLDYDIYKVSYLWSFYHSDKVELAAGLGLHITRIAVGLQAETTSSGVEANDASLTLPLPVLSFGLSYGVTEKLSWFLKTEAFSIEIEEWTGSYTDSSLGVDYRILKNLGVGIGLASNTLKVSQDTDEYKFTYGNRIAGLSLYVSGIF